MPNGSWQFQEMLATLRGHQDLITQATIVLITSSGVLAFKNRTTVVNTPLFFGTVALICGILSLLAGFDFRSELIDIIPGLARKENPTSLTSDSLKCTAIFQLFCLTAGTITIFISAATTPSDGA